MNQTLIQPNEVLVNATIVDGNPAVLVSNDFDQKRSCQVEIGVSKDSADAEKISAAYQAALEHGEKFIFQNSLMTPKSSIYDGDAEALRKPEAKGKLVVRAKSSSIPLLINTDHQEDISPENWTTGTHVKAFIAFYPYNVNFHTGVSATVKFMALVKKANSLSLHDMAIALLSETEET